MIFQQTKIAGVWRVLPQPFVDDRGYFARAFCSEEFAAHGLPVNFEQSSVSHTTRAGTIRGLHYQPCPHAEAKLVRCVRGVVFDVAVDIRKDSPTRGLWVSELLSAQNGVALYISPGLAHGFQTLEPESDVLYQISPAYRPGVGAGVRWNDPAFAIDWPLPRPILAQRDANYPDWRA